MIKLDNSSEPGQEAQWPALVFLLCLLYATWSLSVGWSHTVLDIHGFRQSQSLIPVEYMLRGGHWLRYQTPVLGPPWTVPFELPLYQWIVSGVVAAWGMPIVQAGRLVSVLFLFLTLAPLLAIQSYMGVSRYRRLIIPSLLLVSPLYVFWSRTPLIETTALFLGLTYLALVTRALFHPTGRTLPVVGAAAVLGAAAATVKVTTFATFLAAAVALLLFRHVFKRNAGETHGLRIVLDFSLIALVPLLATVGWTQFADAQKALNPLAARYTSGNLTAWTFGTLSQKVDFWSWVAYLHRTTVRTVGNSLLIVASLPLALCGPVRFRRAFLGCAGLFLLGPLLFTNLHFVHGYYPVANGVFLVAMIGLGAVSALESTGPIRHFGIALLIAALVAGPTSYRHLYYPLQAQDHPFDSGLTQAVQQSVSPDDVVLVYGGDWSPELAFYLHRRVVMDRDRLNIRGNTMSSVLRSVRQDNRRVAGVIICTSARSDTTLIANAANTLRVSGTPDYVGQSCDFRGLTE